MSILFKEVRKHRDGTTTTHYKQEVPLTEIARRVAVHEKIIKEDEQLPSTYGIKLRHELHGSRVYTYLTITGPGAPPASNSPGEWTYTKSEVGTMLDAHIETLDNITVLWSESVIDDFVYDPAIVNATDEECHGQNAIRDLVIEIMFPHDDGSGKTSVMSPTVEQLQKLYDLAMAEDEFELVSALDNRDEERVTDALKEYLTRNGVNPPVSDYPDGIIFFVNGVNDDFNPSGIEIQALSTMPVNPDGVVTLPASPDWNPPQPPHPSVYKKVKQYAGMLKALGINLPKDASAGDAEFMKSIDQIMAWCDGDAELVQEPESMTSSRLMHKWQVQEADNLSE